MEELYAKVQKPRDRKKPSKEVTRDGKELLMNGSGHAMEDSSPPPLPVSGMCGFICHLLLYIHVYIPAQYSNTASAPQFSIPTQYTKTHFTCICVHTYTSVDTHVHM